MFDNSLLIFFLISFGVLLIGELWIRNRFHIHQPKGTWFYRPVNRLHTVWELTLFVAFLAAIFFVVSAKQHFLLVFFSFFALKDFIRGIMEYVYKREERRHFVSFFNSAGMLILFVVIFLFFT